MNRRIYVVSRPVIDPVAIREALASESTEWAASPRLPCPEALVELAARLCFMSFGEKQRAADTAGFLASLLRRGHESVIEHANWSILFVGVSRAFTHQLVRHRVGVAFSQLSQQYHDESEARFVEPAEIQTNPIAHSLWQDTMNQTRESYRKIIDILKKTPQRHTSTAFEETRSARSAARSVLPNATYTCILMTANARALRHILSVRGSIEGDFEMRSVMVELLRAMKTEAPSLFSDFHEELCGDGSSRVVRRSC